MQLKVAPCQPPSASATCPTSHTAPQLKVQLSAARLLQKQLALKALALLRHIINYDSWRLAVTATLSCRRRFGPPRRRRCASPG